MDDINQKFIETHEQNIEQSQSRIALLSHQIREEEEKVRNAQREIARIKYGVTVGSIVEHRGIQHRVTSIDARWGDGKPWLEGNPMKKNGTFGIAIRHLYSDWEKVDG